MKPNDTVPDEWKTEHLLLLIGGNALPNFVAARLLLREGGTLHLLHSPGTGGVARAIARQVKAEYLTHEISDPASMSAVTTVVADVLDRQCQGRPVGLHYTGGTKSMAVHAHAEVRRRRPDALLTYLDSRTLQLYCDSNISPRPVQFAVHPTIMELLGLQELTVKHEENFVEPDGRPKMPLPTLVALNQALARAHTQKEGCIAYDAWCKENLRRGKNLVDKASQFPNRPVPLPMAPSLNEVAEQLRAVLHVTEDSFEPHDIDWLGVPGIGSVEHFVKHLDGQWVEHLVLETLVANREAFRLGAIGISLDTNEKSSPYDFEFDVAAMQGYQLYAFSCTRDATKQLCKHKLFEAVVRAEQLGGSEAKTALVCAYAMPEMLEREARERWRPESDNRIRVFGAADLPNLAERIGEWIGYS